MTAIGHLFFPQYRLIRPKCLAVDIWSFNGSIRRKLNRLMPTVVSSHQTTFIPSQNIFLPRKFIFDASPSTIPSPLIGQNANICLATLTGQPP